MHDRWIHQTTMQSTSMAVADRRPQGRGDFADLRRPSDHDLITFVLHPMVVARQQQQQQQRFDGGGGEFFHLADVYSVAPERLTERYPPAPAPGRTCWYFICPACCRNRAVAGALGEGRWSPPETGEVVSPVRGADGLRVGSPRTLYYSYGGGARTTPTPCTTVTRHGWCMVELALDDEHDGGGGVGGGGDFVLCKLFRSSPHNGASSPTAAAAVAARTAVPALLFDCKRKAVGDHPEAPPSVRQQLAVQHSF